MKSLHRKTLGWAAAIWAIASPVLASPDPEAAEGSWAPFMAEIVLLLLVAACLLAVVKVYLSVRGGSIAHGWFFFVLGFAVLGVAQIVLFAGRLGFFTSPDFWVATIRIVAVVVMLMGATRMKRLFT